ncbi:hypothetical protein PMIN02_002851 [Paraphaeosphaeria minitans]|uniref:RING-type domain-containing protein n=1 Tax=Paraphaeosphaeria minitans TaxID=565426 RepID=A0A9P6G6E3_9PLEO|nr:hypothetical protein PMIN01_13085 [Paraphaeosphaeria minitans]
MFDTVDLSREEFLACHLRLAAKQEDMCSVCLEAFCTQNPALQIPDCAHTFHFECLAIWTDTASTCPMCRGTLFKTRLLSKEYHKLARSIIQASSDPVEQVRSVVTHVLSPRKSLSDWNPTRHTVRILFTLMLYKTREKPQLDAISKELLNWVFADVGESGLEPNDRHAEVLNDYNQVENYEEIDEDALTSGFEAYYRLRGRRFRREELDDVFQGPGLLPSVRLAEWYYPRSNAEAPLGVEWRLRKLWWQDF